MLPDHTNLFPLLVSVLTSPLLLHIAHAQAAPSVSFLQPRDHDASNPLNIHWGPAPAPEDGPPLSRNALRDPAYLPAQIGAIVGSYAVSLVLVAFALLALSKKRREHIQLGNEEVDFEDVKDILSPRFAPAALSIIVPEHPQTGVPNFSYPSPTKSEFQQPGPYIYPSPVSSIVSWAPGVNPLVDQRKVVEDRVMAQDQLEEMYKYVMEHEEAKQNGIVLEAPVIPGAVHRSPVERTPPATLSKKERTKPANLNLSAGREEKTQSRTSSLLSALRSPKKKSVKALNISSPIMTPQSATFPRGDFQEIPLRQYAPQPPPPLPTGPVPLSPGRMRSNAPLTPDISPESVQSIDERIGAQLAEAGTSDFQSYHHSRAISQAPTEVDPESATSMHSQVPLVGLPSSPKPGATFQRPNPPSAVRTGGSLPLRAYEPALSSPSAISHTTKQTVFERKAPLSPMGARTPMTAGAVPYSPYQPFTPMMPMTPSLVTREDRKRMKRAVPKTPTVEMVRSSEDIW